MYMFIIIIVTYYYYYFTFNTSVFLTASVDCEVTSVTIGYFILRCYLLCTYLSTYGQCDNYDLKKHNTCA